MSERIPGDRTRDRSAGRSWRKNCPVERIFPDLEQLGLTHSAAILAINATEKHSPPMPYDFASPTATEDQSESLPPEAAIVL